MKLLKDLGHQPQLPLRIIFGTDEESGMSDIPHYLAVEQPPRFGFTPDCKYPVVYGERGVVNVQLDFPLPTQEQQLLAAFSGDQFRDHVPDHLSVTVGSQSFEALGKRSPSNAPELGTMPLQNLRSKRHHNWRRHRHCKQLCSGSPKVFTSGTMAKALIWY